MPAACEATGPEEVFDASMLQMEHSPCQLCTQSYFWIAHNFHQKRAQDSAPRGGLRCTMVPGAPRQGVALSQWGCGAVPAAAVIAAAMNAAPLTRTAVPVAPPQTDPISVRPDPGRAYPGPWSEWGLQTLLGAFGGGLLGQHDLVDDGFSIGRRLDIDGGVVALGLLVVLLAADFRTDLGCRPQRGQRPDEEQGAACRHGGLGTGHLDPTAVGLHCSHPRLEPLRQTVRRHLAVKVNLDGRRRLRQAVAQVLVELLQIDKLQFGLGRSVRWIVLALQRTGGASSHPQGPQETGQEPAFEGNRLEKTRRSHGVIGVLCHWSTPRAGSVRQPGPR